MQLDHDGLRERGDGYGLFDLGGDIAHAKFQRAERRMRTHVPPDFLAAVDAVQLDQQVQKILVRAPGFELFWNTGAREAPKDRSAIRLQAGVAAHPEWRTGGERKQVREEG